METSTIDITASVVTVILYLLSILTIARILLGTNHKVHKRMSRLLDIPMVGPIVYWLYFALSGKKKPKHHHHSK